MKHAAVLMQRAGACMVAMALTSIFIAGTPVAPVEPVASPPAADQVDLDRLVPNATGELHANFVAPESGGASPIAATQVVVSTVRGAVVALSINGVAVPSKQLGKRTVDLKTGETQFTFYGVALEPGSNTLTATPIGAGGVEGPAVSEIVYGPAEAASIRAEFVQHLVADGVTAAPLNVTVVDRFGHAAMPAQSLRIALLSGDVRLLDTEKLAVNPGAATPAPAITSSPGQNAAGQVVDTVVPVGGYLALRVQPGTVSGPFEIEITAGKAHLRKQFYVEPYVRPPFVNGVVSVGTGVVPAAIDGNGIPDLGGARKARAGIFASGAIDSKTLVTAAYESQNQLSPVSSFGPYTQDPNERPYQTYGDTSQMHDTLHSADHVYARIERGQSSVMWGQFNAKVGPPDVGAYQQLLSGAHASVSAGREGRFRADAFIAHDDQAFVSQILPLSGLANLTRPLHPDIVVGSDYLTVAALDRKTGIVISQTPLLRNVDYTIDYATGIIRFINIPLPFDAQFNPQVLSIQYDYAGPGAGSRTAGAQLQADLSSDRRTRATIGYIDDQSGGQNFALNSQSISRTWAQGSWSIAHASSSGTLAQNSTLLPVGGSVVPGHGDALSAMLTAKQASDEYAFAYQTTTPGYNDSFGGISTPGLSAYRVAWKHGEVKRGAIVFAYSGQANRGIGPSSDERDANLRFERALGRAFNLTAGVVFHDQRVASAAPTPGASANPAPQPGNTAQMQAQLGLDYRPNPRLGMSALAYRTLIGSDVGSTQPSQTIAQVTYALPNRGQLFLRELWSGQPSAVFANSTTNLGLAGGATHSMQFGIEKALSPATTISSQYVVNDTGSALNVYDALGVQERLRLGRSITANADVESANASGSGALGFTLIGGTLAYAQPQGTMRASLSLSRSDRRLERLDLLGRRCGQVVARRCDPGFGAARFRERHRRHRRSRFARVSIHGRRSFHLAARIHAHQRSLDLG